MGFNTFEVKEEGRNENTLRLNLRNGDVQGVLSAASFIDKDTKQHITYIPALELSGYGETKEQAIEMIKFSMDQLFCEFMRLSAKDLQSAMESYGWHKELFNRRFSKSFVDMNGILQDFNIEENSLNRITLVTA